MHSKKRPVINCYKLLTVATAILFCILLCYKTMLNPIWRDDAFFGSVAKNIADGHGYRAVFFDQNYLFHFGISTGPLLILPLAAMIKIFGNQYWVPGFTVLIIIFMQMITCACLARHLFKNSHSPAFWKCMFLCLLCLIITTQQKIKMPDFPLFLWHGFMGDIPSILFVLMGTFMVFSPSLCIKTILGGSILLGCAINTKIIAVIAIGGIGITFALRICRERLPYL